MTHYDTLKVTQDAPAEVISAAYKALARIYHPDKNTTTEAILIMQNINIAYGVLSDPTKKAEHDLWIRSQSERVERRETETKGQPRPSSASGSAAQVKADKAAAEASKWTAWSDKVAQEAKETQTRADKAAADLAKAQPADRAKWEAWANKTAQEAKETRERANKAAAQAAKAVTDALEAAAQAQAQKTGNK